MFAIRRFKLYSWTIVLALVCSMDFVLPMPIQAKEQPTSFGEELRDSQDFSATRRIG